MEQQRQEARDVPAAEVMKRPVVLPETFNGEGNWTEWFEHFESVAAVNGWQDRDKLLWLRVRLVGRAATAFRRVDDGARDSYADCIEALKEWFDPRSKRELYLAELLARKKRRSEDWATFAEDLKLLVDKAYPELQDDAREQLALTHYLGQLEQPQLAFSVKQRRPRTVDEAVRTTLEMESYLLPKSTRVARVEESQQGPTVGAINHGQPDAVMVMLEQIVKRIDSLEAKLENLTKENQSLQKQKPADGQKGRGSQTQTGSVIKCHRCGKPGHLAKGCLAPRPQQGRSSQSGNDRPSV